MACKKNDKVIVSNNGKDRSKTSRIFIKKIAFNPNLYICVKKGCENNYKNGKEYNIEGWTYIKSIEKQNLNLENFHIGDPIVYLDEYGYKTYQVIRNIVIVDERLFMINGINPKKIKKPTKEELKKYFNV